MSHEDSPRRLLPRAKLKKRYNVTEMTVWRWERDPTMALPLPIMIGSTKFYDIDELETWEESRRLKLAPAFPAGDGPRPKIGSKPETFSGEAK